uniref:DUF3730 domain-containing protein n=3 Tax=Bombyx mori TaxID=7091 RepID=A0A8R2M4H9_BOMMO|nr:focadhesin isoform X1 [Bombyx mori]
MDEIEYKLKTNNSVLIVNAVEKLITLIKSKFKREERQRFVLENEELKFLRKKCSSKDPVVSLTACQGLLALVELGVLEIPHTMSTVVTLIPTAQISCNYSAIISTMAGLLILDLKSRLDGYKCQFNLKSPKHPFITVLEKNKGAEDDVLAQMHSLCTHPDYTVSSNSLELLRAVFLWLTCNPQRDGGSRPWQLLLSLPQGQAKSLLLLACLSCQQICNSSLIERAFSAYSAVTDAAIYQQDKETVRALLPMLARITNELIKHGRDPRPCYILMERCFNLDAAELRTVAGLVLMILADNLPHTSALYLHELFNLCLNIINKYAYTQISINYLIALTLQWLNMPSYLTASALKSASRILDIYQEDAGEDTRMYMTNLNTNKTFQTLLHTDKHLSIVYNLNRNYERLRDNPDKLKCWVSDISSLDNAVKYDMLPLLLGVAMSQNIEGDQEEIVLQSLNILIDLVDYNKDMSVQLLPILLYKISHDISPSIKMECLKALPLMAKSKENVPTIVSILNKLKVNKGVPISFLISLYTSLSETQVRCFPYLQELLVDPGAGRPDDLKWEVDVARALSVKRICEIRGSSHGVELVSVISTLLNRCGDKSGSAATSAALQSIARLWRSASIAPPSTWRALEPKLGRDTRPLVQISVCNLLAEVPALRVSTPDYDWLISASCRRLWAYVADSNHPEVVEAACDALGGYLLDDYKLKDIPEIYRRTVKLPASYCKTPADAARNPEDVLEYIPCEVWPEVFKCSNQAALGGVARLTTRLIEREIKGYRSGVYHLEAKTEPMGYNHLQPFSVIRGLMECFRKQATSPSFDYSDEILLAILQALTSDYPRPLPPIDLCFLPEMFHRGRQWKELSVRLAARQALVSISAKRIMDNYLQSIEVENCDESDILTVYELLPTLCRGMPPNSLRAPIEKTLGRSHAIVSKTKSSDNPEELLFVKLLVLIRRCLESEKIHDANRKLLSQMVENYYSVIDESNVSWDTYVETCRSLSSAHLERMTSPSSWWEASGEALRRAWRVRCEVARGAPGGIALVWLNEMIDAQASSPPEQDFSLRCMAPVLQAADPGSAAARDWFLQLMARTQVAFNETEDLSAKLYLCDVFVLSVVTLSGHGALRPGDAVAGDRAAARALFPAAVAALFSREPWEQSTPQILEWLCHTRSSVADPRMAQCCQRGLLSMRHAAHFATHNTWIKLESHLARENIED